MRNLNRQRGSPEEFEQDWHSALEGNVQRFLIYPATEPVKQDDLFELVKAELVMDILLNTGVLNGRVLEFGCGTAGMSIYLANRGFYSIACDISRNALLLAGINAKIHLGECNLFFRTCADTFTLPFDDDAFDVVMSYGLLEHFNTETLSLLMTEVLRVLRPGGLFVADIAHGRFSVRRVGNWLNLAGSLTFHLLTFRWHRLKSLPRYYTDHFFENDLNEQDWVRKVKIAGLDEVGMRICHPFPPLALSGLAERVYINALQLTRPIWDWFNHSQPSWGRHWGWLYLIWGVKPVTLSKTWSENNCDHTNANTTNC